LRISQITALRAARAGGFFLGQFGKVRAAIEPLDNVERIFFGFHQDVPGGNLGFGFNTLDPLVIGLFSLVYRNGVTNLAVIIQIVEGPVAVIGHDLLGGIPFIDALFLRGFRKELIFDDVEQEISAAFCSWHVCNLLANFRAGNFNIPFGDLNPIHGRENFGAGKSGAG